MKKIIDSLSEMHSILGFFREHQYSRVPETAAFKMMVMIEKWFGFTVIVLFVVTCGAIFLPAEARMAAIVSGFGAMTITGATLAIWKPQFERGLKCTQCGQKLKMTAGKWIEIESSERRIVVYSCETCMQYFYHGEEDLSSNAGG